MCAAIYGKYGDNGINVPPYRYRCNMQMHSRGVHPRGDTFVSDFSLSLCPFHSSRRVRPWRFRGRAAARRDPHREILKRKPNRKRDGEKRGRRAPFLIWRGRAEPSRSSFPPLRFDCPAVEQFTFKFESFIGTLNDRAVACHYLCRSLIIINHHLIPRPVRV